MTGDLKAFLPTGVTRQLDATTVSARRQILTGSTVAIYNAGPSIVFVTEGGNTITATVAKGMPIAPGKTFVFSLHPETTHIGGITSSGTASVYISKGEGR